MTEHIVDWGNRAQAAAEAHIEAVWEHHHAVEDEVVGLGPDPAIGPFCGCTTCEVREILLAAIPVIAQGIVAGELDPRDLVGGA